MLSEQVHATLELSEPASFARLSEHLPMAWIEQALAATGTASVRRRRLPAQQVVWLVIALALYRHQSIPDVLETLDLALPNDANACVSKSGIAQARERLGDKPLLWLFEQTARAWVAQDAARYKWKGLALYAMDGTTFRTADSPENRLHFGAQNYAGGKVASYPQVRGVSLTAVPTHLVADIAFGRYGCNEMLYAKALVERVPDDSLTIFDKGFLAAEILWGLRMAGKERHFLIPAKKNLQWERLSGSEDDGIVQMKVSPQARRKNPALPETWSARAIRVEGTERILLTSLTDRRRFKAADIIRCYQRRWEIETSYRELKQTMLGAELTLRSRQPEGVYLEIWGALIAYNLVRLEMAKAALEARVEPTDLSVILALRLIQGELVWAAGMAPGKLPAHLQRMRLKLQLAIVQKRRGRKCPRVVKALPKRYTVRVLSKDTN